MSYKSHRLDSFCNNGFQSVEKNVSSKTECCKHDPYLSSAFKWVEPTALMITSYFYSTD